MDDFLVFAPPNQRLRVRRWSLSSVHANLAREQEKIMIAIAGELSGTGFSLWVLGFAGTKPHRLKPVPLNP
jgi:hypothetical protein